MTMTHSALSKEKIVQTAKGLCLGIIVVLMICGSNKNIYAADPIADALKQRSQSETSGYDAKQCEDKINQLNTLYVQQRTLLQSKRTADTDRQLEELEASQKSRTDTTKSTPPCVTISDALRARQTQPQGSPSTGGQNVLVTPPVPPLMFDDNLKKLVVLKVPEPQRSQLLLQYQTDWDKCKAAQPGTPEATTQCAKAKASADTILRAVG